MAITKIQSGAFPADVVTTAAIDDLSVTHAKLHTAMDLSSKTVTLPTLSTLNITGNVGIGETSPLGKLHVKTADSGATADVSADELVIEGSGNTGISILSGASNAGSIYFGDSGTNWDGYIAYNQSSRSMTFGVAAGGGTVNINSSGDVGIGTASPDGKLTVALENSNTPAFRLASPTSGTDFAISSYNDANGTYVSMGVNHLFNVSGNDAVMDTNDKSAAIVLDGRNNGRIQFLTNSSGIATPRMTILQDGKVGIGTTSPVENLDLRFSGRHGIICGSTSGAGSYIVLDGAGNGDGAGGDYAYIEHTSSGNLNFNVGNGSNSTNTKMLIEPAGNVGIGMSDPAYKLDVGGVGAVQQRLKSSGDTGYTQGALVIESSDSSSNPGNRGQGVYYYNVPNQRTWYTGTLYNNGNKFGFGYRQVSGFQVDAADNLHAVMVIDGDSKEVGIGVTNPSATLHVEDDGTGGNSGHMKLGHTRTRTFYAGIASSENRWYKVLNYGTGNMFTGKVQIYITRSGGFNQTGAHKEYRASLGGYSNSVYGPLSLSGDGGEGGVASLEIGSDAGVYLRVNSSIYGGAVYVTFSGQGNMSWTYSNSSYSTSLP